MKNDAQKLLDDLKKSHADRKKVSLFLSDKLYERFKKGCKPVSASQVMERLMEDFLKALSKK